MGAFSDYIPSLVAAVVGALALLLISRLSRWGGLQSRHRVKHQAVILGLSAVAFLVVILLLPFQNEMRALAAVHLPSRPGRVEPALVHHLLLRALPLLQRSSGALGRGAAHRVHRDRMARRDRGVLPRDAARPVGGRRELPRGRADADATRIAS
jgi:hypothetical protein